MRLQTALVTSMILFGVSSYAAQDYAKSAAEIAAVMKFAPTIKELGSESPIREIVKSCAPGTNAYLVGNGKRFAVIDVKYKNSDQSDFELKYMWAGRGSIVEIGICD